MDGEDDRVDRPGVYGGPRYNNLNARRFSSVASNRRVGLESSEGRKVEIKRVVTMAEGSLHSPIGPDEV